MLAVGDDAEEGLAPQLSVSPQPLKPALPVRRPTAPSSPSDETFPTVDGPPAPDLPARGTSALPALEAAVDSRPVVPPPLPERSRTLNAVSDSLRAEDAYLPPLPPPPPPPLRAAGAREGKLPFRAVARSVSRVTAVSASSSRPTSDSSSDSGYVPPPPPQRVEPTGRPPAGSGSPLDDEDEDAVGAAVDDSDPEEDEGLSLHGPAGGSTGLSRATSMAQRKMDEYPDPTFSNRRPPHLAHRPQPIRHASGHNAHAGPSAFACADRFVAVGAHGLRVYDAESAGLELVCRLDQREAGLDVRSDKARISALCFRPSQAEGEANRWLWAGTSEGHLFEVDVWSSIVSQVKPAVHHHHHHSSNGSGGGSSSSSSSGLNGAEITHIWSHGGRMLVYDESGRAALYATDPDGHFNLSQPMSMPRLAERQSFAALLGGQVWASAGPSSSSSSSNSVRASGKSPAIRVHEPFVDGTGVIGGGVAGRVLAVPDSVTGAILCGTVLPSQPALAYFGHEGGLISSWDRRSFVFVGAVKVGTTAITSLEGVGDRLWAGSRKGVVSVYDVETRPWSVTNMWAAHECVDPSLARAASEGFGG
jgi:hypothetical protein